MKEDPIDPEKLAAFLDGTLTEAERADVLRQLARSRRAFETLAGAAATLTEINEGAKGARKGSWLRPLPGSGRWLAQRVVLVAVPTLAAALIAAILLVPASSLREADPVALAGTILPAAGGETRPQLPPDWHEAGWSRTRGEPVIINDGARAFRLGARLVTLELAWRSGAGVADAVRDDVVGMLRTIEGATLMAARYQTELSATSSEDDRRRAAGDVREILLDSPWFDLGVWTQAARIATEMQNAGFFETRRVRRSLSAVVDGIAADRMTGRSAPAALGHVVDLTQDGVQPAEWLSLRLTLDSVINQSGQ